MGEYDKGVSGQGLMPLSSQRARRARLLQQPMQSPRSQMQDTAFASGESRRQPAFQDTTVSHAVNVLMRQPELLDVLTNKQRRTVCEPVIDQRGKCRVQTVNGPCAADYLYPRSLCLGVWSGC